MNLFLKMQKVWYILKDLSGRDAFVYFLLVTMPLGYTSFFSSDPTLENVPSLFFVEDRDTLDLCTPFFDLAGLVLFFLRLITNLAT